VRLVVTGAGGGLGRAFLDVVPGHHDVVALTHDQLDIGLHGAVMATVPKLRPDAVLNFAAFTQVDRNETEPERAFHDNAQGPHSLALAALACGAILLHVSTDYVFDGRKALPYDETDRADPLSVYGRSKLAGERFVRQTLTEHYIVRTGFVFGSGDDYLAAQLDRLARGEEARGIEDRTGTPTFVRHLAERLVPLLLTGRFGTYHLAGTQPMSWHQLLLRCKELGDLPGSVTAQRADELGLPAQRPRNSALASVFVGALGLPAMPSLDEALRAVLEGP
jgi:dTDP-4-dehydrorhamnose reductase